MSETKLNYAGFGIRLLAAIIDGIIFGIIYWPFEFGFGLLYFGSLDSYFANQMAPSDLMYLIYTNLLTFVLGWFYFSLFLSSKMNATLGKKLLKLQVVDLQGERNTFGKATLRYIGYYLSAIILFIGYLMVLFRKDKRALHDLLAGTIVIRIR